MKKQGKIKRIDNIKAEPALPEELDDIIASIDKDKLNDPGKPARDPAIIKIVNCLIVHAIGMNASDIHVEPEEKILNVRYRIDGMLHHQASLPKGLSGALLERLKAMSGINNSGKCLPMEGRITLKVSDRSVDLRVSFCPTVNGENIVLRIMERGGIAPALGSLGFPRKEYRLFRDIINSKYGIVLVAGPAGSGKTTTLYSALRMLNKEDVNIMTVEDPVEYRFPGMRQVQVDRKEGLTFAMALRSFLRQDPDILMAGEIRDRETARVAVEAALTGHLVFSSLHTNDSSSSFGRLIDMGIEPFLVSSSVLGVLAQRLVRRVCGKCKKMYVPSDDIIRNLGIEKGAFKKIRFARGEGCAACSDSGYSGRIGIYELLKMTPEIQGLILNRASADQIRALALREGLTSLRHAVMDKLFAGLTSVEEVFRVTLDSE